MVVRCSTVRSLMLVLRWPCHDSQLARGESASVFAGGEAEIHETLPLAFVRPSRRDRAISPSRSPGSGRAKARCSERCWMFLCPR